jgi:hypothetical protein
MNSLLAANEHPQKQVEANEVVDMGMRDEDLLDAVNLPWRQRRDVSEVEQKGMLLEQRFDIEGRIAISIIDQTGV